MLAILGTACFYHDCLLFYAEKVTLSAMLNFQHTYLDTFTAARSLLLLTRKTIWSYCLAVFDVGRSVSLHRLSSQCLSGSQTSELQVTSPFF